MALKRTVLHCLLAFGALSSVLICLSAPLLADDEATPDASPTPPGIMACNDVNVQRMFNETTAFYRRVTSDRAKAAHKKPVKGKKNAGVSAQARYYDKEVDRLWSRLPDCSTPDKRGDLSHHAFKQYMNAMLMEAYESAFLKLDAQNLHDARFYVNCYLAVDNGVRNEARAEGWSSWLAFEAQSLPRIHALQDQLFKAGF